MGAPKKYGPNDPFEEDELKYKGKDLHIDESILKEELNLTSHITGRVDSLRNTILSFIAEHRFDLAIRELKMYRNHKADENEVHLYMSQEHFRKCVQIVRSMQNILAGVELRTLPLAKRQDIYDRVVMLFESLKTGLNNLAAVENNIKVKDLKSTVTLLKVGIAAVFLLAVFAASIEGLATMDRPIDVMVNDATAFIFSIFGT